MRNKLEQIRERAGRSVEFVAAAAGVSGPTVRNWESGRYSPTLAQARLVAACLRTRVDEIWPVEKEPAGK